MRQYKRAMEWEDDEDRMKKTLIMFVKDNLRLYKSHFNQVTQEIQDLKSSMTSLKVENWKNLEDRVPMGTISRLRSRLEHEPILNASIAMLDRRVTRMEGQLNRVKSSEAISLTVPGSRHS